MRRELWVEFYASTGHFPNLQRGAALDLLVHQGSHGILPADDEVLASICRVSLRVWREKLAALFDPLFVPTSGGRAWMPLYREQGLQAAKAAEASRKRQVAGRKGAEARWRPPGGRSNSLDGGEA